MILYKKNSVKLCVIKKKKRKITQSYTEKAQRHTEKNHDNHINHT